VLQRPVETATQSGPSQKGKNFLTKLEHIPWKRLSIEAAAIVTSILLAFAIDAWWDDLAQARDEIESLDLIRRDLSASIEQLETYSAYAAGASRSALSAYAALSGPGPYDRENIRNEMLRVDRVTLRIPTAAYSELLSSGNLRVIEDRSLRDEIVQFYESVELTELIIQNNNDEFLDRQLMGVYYGRGLMLAHMQSDVGDDNINTAYKVIRERLGVDFVHQSDPLWNYQPDSPEWRILRSSLLYAAQNHIIGETLAQEKVVTATQLKESIENWLNTIQ